MSREHPVYDRDRVVNPDCPPVKVAMGRATRFEDPVDRSRFMEAFNQARVATSRGKDLYLALRCALEEDDSVRVTGLIEGCASVPRGFGKVL